MIQILSKEMFYHLNEQSKKMIVFSDSREEAARVSNGIERSHYQDLVREIFYNELQLIVKGQPVLLSEAELSYSEPKDILSKRYEAEHPGSFEELKDNLQHIKNYKELQNPSDKIQKQAEEYQEKNQQHQTDERDTNYFHQYFI